jgi:lysophospholipase L1-like esterase
MKSRLIRYLIVVVSVIAILFALIKVLAPSKKVNTYLAIGDYLSVSGNLKGEKINSFSSMLGDYLLDGNFVEVSNYNYTYSDIDSGTLLEMICKDAYSGNDGGLVSLIKDSKYITISVGMNDILQYIRFDSNNQKLEYNKDYIKRKLEILKQNYYEIIEEIKELNDEASVYLVGYYYPFEWVDEDNKECVNEVFKLLNDSIKEVGDLMSVYYVDISEVSKEENMYSRYQIYLNQMGHEYVFSVFKNNYFC